jgi:hypothetical protein
MSKFSDRTIFCRCGATIGRTHFDSQVLILENGLTLFNYACWLCGSCKKFYNSWLAPELPTARLTNLEKFPDGQKIERRAVKIRKNFQTVISRSELSLKANSTK